MTNFDCLIDREALKAEMKKRRMTFAEIAVLLGISRMTLRKRMYRQCEFTESECFHLRSVFGTRILVPRRKRKEEGNDDA